MPQTIVLVATRKGLFVLESENRKDWKTRDRSARAGRSTTRSTTRTRGRSSPRRRASGSARRSGKASDLGETWEQSSEGLTYGDDSDLKLNKISSLSAKDLPPSVLSKMPHDSAPTNSRPWPALSDEILFSFRSESSP